MLQIPDAPWIREAERDGMPSAPEVYCPVCGEECKEIYLFGGSDVVGCEHCISCQDAIDWYYDEIEKGE